ncbi:MAG TPA: cell wall hydrolase, partial [Rhizomicrobium sp.]|nr:cell wall hydrolase [Rhizomicrobium sp.]
MMDGVGKAHKRADGAVVAAVSLLVLGTAPLIGVNLYTDKNDALVAPQQIVEAVQVEWSSPAELAGAKLASESDCLAQVMYYEARGEGLAGEKAVAEVVLRRTHNGNYARTVCGVVHEGVREGHKTGCQFSFACDGSLDRPK